MHMHALLHVVQDTALRYITGPHSWHFCWSKVSILIPGPGTSNLARGSLSTFEALSPPSRLTLSTQQAYNLQDVA